ncbi:MAG: flagellar hook-associated protein FlgL [Lactobacillus sp.]|nr:flagellar hook-associated protein FlgL [Lactobacillus sp.]
MRISTNMVNADFLNNLATTTNKVQSTMNQLASLKEVNKASDNPLLVSKILDLNVSISQNSSYATTISDAKDWTTTQDGALQLVERSMNNIRNIIVAVNNSGTLTDAEFKAYRSELQQEIGTVVDAMNTNYDGRYIFGGAKTTEPPFEVTKDANGEVNGLKYNGDETNLAREISNGVSINLLTNGNSVMNAQGAGKDLGTFFNELVADLDKHDEASIADLSKKLGEVDVFKNNIVNYDTRIGAIENRIDAAKDRNDSEKITLKNTLSTRQDVDIAQKYMEYQNQMLAYKSTLAMGTKIMQTTVLDYM